MGGGSIVGGRYELVRKLAEGGMGAVWEARHTLSKKVVALKILGAETIRDETSRARFLREVAAPAQIGHDGIVEVYDAGFDPAAGALFVAMEMLEGETLRALLVRGHLSVSRVVEIVLALLPALAAAHAAGFIHRDLKPENVFLHRRRDGIERVKILDFGIARSRDQESSVTQSGVAMGTPHYMSPEQAASARDVTAATDVWAVGVILYEALVHVPPFRGDTLASLVVDVLTRPHRPTLDAAPSVPPALAAVVDRCLQKDANLRPRDGAALLAVLGAAAATCGLAPHVGGARPLPATVEHTPERARIERGVAATMLGTLEGQGGPGGAHPGATPAPTSPAGGSDARATPGWGGHGSAPGVPTMPTASASHAPSWAGSSPGAAGFPHTSGIPSAAAASSSPVPTYTMPTPSTLAGPGGGPSAPATSATPTPVAAPSDARSPWFWPAIALGAVTVVVVPLVLLMGIGLAAYAYGAHTLRGSLAGGDLVLAGGQLYDTYEYEWRAGGRVELHARSSAFDTHIILHTPSGRQLDSSDSDGARIDMTLVESGPYRVIVTSRRAFQSGEYELEIDEP